MTQQTLSPEAFLALPPDAEEDDSAGPAPSTSGHSTSGHSTSITVTPPSGDSLQAIADAIERVVEQLKLGRAGSAPSVPAEQHEALREAHMDLQAKHEALSFVLEDIAAIVEKSTSKVSLEVKAAIKRWESPDEPTAKSEREEQQDQTPGSPVGDEPPAPDAPVESWRAYARPRLGEDADLSQLNRSQIRTALGLAHPGQEG